MLSKDVCKKCLAERGGWDWKCDYRWQHQKMAPCGIYDEDDVRVGDGMVEGPPPRGCHHRFEQSVAEGMIEE